MKYAHEVIGLCLVGFLIFAGPVWAGDATQQVSAKILQIGVGPRAVGMGEAQTAIADDIYALYWNPAGLASMEQNQVSFMHNSWFGGINSEYFTYGQMLAEGAIGLSFNYLGFGEFEKYGVDINNLPVPLGGTFNAFSLVTSVGYGLKLLPELSVGAAVKLVSQSADTYNTITGAVDLGAQYKKIWRDLDIALVIQNLGLPIQGFALPLMFKAGASYPLPFLLDPKKDNFTAVLDLSLPVPIDQPFYTNVGFEYVYDHMVALRAGYKISEINSLGGISGLTAGAGLTVSDYSLDYALASFGELGLTHRISISANLGESKRPKGARRLTLPATIGDSESASGPGEISVPRLSLTMRLPVTVQVAPEVNPSVKTRVDRAVFAFQINNELKIQKWDLRIRDAKGEILKELAGKGDPGKIIWDGRNPEGQYPPNTVAAMYDFAYSLEDGTADKITGRVVEPETLPVNTEAPAVDNQEKIPAIPFEEGSFELNPEAMRIVKAAAGKLENRPFSKVIIEGYTDSGSEANQEFVLSQRRVDSVVRVLAITAGKLSVHARGSKNPVDSNQTPAARAKNRRVEITIIYSR